MSELSDVYSAIKRLQTTTTGRLRELLQEEYSAEWTSKQIDVLSVETNVRRKLNILIDLELVQKEKLGRDNIYSVVHNFPVKSRAAEIMDQLESIFREDGALFAKVQKPIIELLNEIKSPYYIRQNVEDISSKEHIITKLEQAINDNNYVDIQYINKPYRVRPLKIAEFEGIWYLLLFYDKDGSYRKFRIIETNGVDVLKEKFILTEQQNLDIKEWHTVWHQPGVKPTRIKLWIGEWVIKYFYQKNIFDINSYPKRVISCSDGAEYEMYITHEFELLSQIMYWQPHVVILEQEGSVDAKGKFLELLNRTIDRQRAFK